MKNSKTKLKKLFIDKIRDNEFHYGYNNSLTNSNGLKIFITEITISLNDLEFILMETTTIMSIKGDYQIIINKKYENFDSDMDMIKESVSVDLEFWTDVESELMKYVKREYNNENGSLGNESEFLKKRFDEAYKGYNRNKNIEKIVKDED